MATKSTPTNTDIITALTSISKEIGAIQSENSQRHIENSNRFDGLEKRLDYTNGNVKDLLLWQSNMRAVDDYKKTIESTPIQAVKVDARPSPIGWKEILAGLGVLATAIALAIAQLGGN